MNLNFWKRLRAGRSNPNRHPVTVPVSVTTSPREHDVCELDSGAGDPLPFDLAGFHGVAEGIRASLREQREAAALAEADRRMRGYPEASRG